MSSWERPSQQQRRKTPSFSSSLLEAIYHSIDESKAEEEHVQEENFLLYRRNNAREAEEEIASLRRAIMIEKWMENYSKNTRSSRHTTSDSGSSTDSSIFSSSETESASRSTPKSSIFTTQSKQTQTFVSGRSETSPKHEGRFVRTKSRALKIYSDLKKVKQPISPGGKIANFLTSIFNSRNLKKPHQGMEDWSTIRRSRSVKDSAMTCSLTSRSCLSKPPSSRGKTKRSVRFCPANVIIYEDCQPPAASQRSTYENGLSLKTTPDLKNHFITKNISTFRAQEEKNLKKYGFKGFHENDSDDEDDGRSCTSSDLFELENVGMVGIGPSRDELPVYGTTSLKMNKVIASGLVM